MKANSQCFGLYGKKPVGHSKAVGMQSPSFRVSVSGPLESFSERRSRRLSWKKYSLCGGYMFYS
jgi:hypothetical protein